MEEQAFFGLQNLRMTTRNTIMTYLGTPEESDEEVEPTMKRIVKYLGEKHLTDDNSFLRQTSKKEFDDSSGDIRRVR